MARPANERVVTQDVVDRPQAVHEADLLPFAHMAGRVADRQFQKASLRATRHGRDFDFHAKALAGERQFFEDWRSEGFVARFNVGQLPPRKAIAKRRDGAVSPVVPEWPIPPSNASEQPAAVNDVRVAVEDRLDETRNLRRVVFEIGVLNNHHVALDRFHASTHGRCFSCISLQANRANSLVGAGRFGDNIWRSVGRSIIDDDHFQSLDRQRQKLIQRNFERRFFVIDRNNDR